MEAEQVNTTPSLQDIRNRGQAALPYTIKPARGNVRPIGVLGRSLGIKMIELNRNDEWLDGKDGISFFYRNPKGAEIIDGREIDKYIVIAEDLTEEEKRLTAAHELAHFVLGHLLGNEFTVTLHQQEFEAEALGFILFNFLYGIDGWRKSD